MGVRLDGMGRRLSKPRTHPNNSSSNLHDLPDLPLEASYIASSDIDYFGDTAIVSSQGERRSRRKSRTRLRAYLYGSPIESSPMISSDEEEGKGSPSLSDAARVARKRLSRTGSSFMQMSSAKTSTTHLSNSSKQLLITDTEESAIVAEQVKERAHRDSLAAQNHVAAPIDEDKHVDSLLAPVRRKSLYTPGIATRNTSDILRKPPSSPSPQSNLSKADREYYYNPKHPDASPLARLAALNVSESGRDTPSNINIPHLGGLQLGTLRVTNGAASPVSHSLQSINFCLSPTPSSTDQEDYQTASEDSSNEGVATPKVLQNQYADPLKSSLITSIPTYDGEQEEWDEVAFVAQYSSDDSGKRSPGCASDIAHTYMAEFDGSHSRSLLVRETDATDEMFDDEAIVIPKFQKVDSEEWTRRINEAEAHQATQGSRDDALKRLNGDSRTKIQSQRLSVPISFSSQDSSAIEGALKVDSGYSSNESLDIDPKANLDYETDRFGEPRTEQFTRPCGVSGQQTMPLNREVGDIRLGLPRHARPSIAVIPKYASTGAGSNINSTSTVDIVKPTRSSNRSSSRSIVRRLQKARPKSQPPPLRLVDGADFHKLSETNIPRVPSLMAVKHAERLTRFPLLEHTFPSLEHVTARNSPTPTEAKQVPIRFPSPANALEAASTGLCVNHTLNEQYYSGSSYPNAPTQIASSCKEGEDDWSVEDMVRAPSWSAFGRNKTKKEQKKLVKKAKVEERRLVKEEQESTRRLEKDKQELERQLRKDEQSRRSFRSRASSRAREKSAERRISQHEAITTIADFGTVAKSLGGSPYDIATSIHSNASRDATSCHPHQMSTAVQKPKQSIETDGIRSLQGSPKSKYLDRPTIPVDEVFGTQELSPARRARPQTMFLDAPPVPALSAVDIRAHNLDWARNRQRSRSYSVGNGGPRSETQQEAIAAFDDHSRTLGKVIGSKSIILDAPPVPDLPSLQHVRQQEARSAENRPQSMFIGAASSDVKSSNNVKAESPSHGRAGVFAPSKSRSSKLAVPDLWSNGSLEKRSPNQETLEASDSERATEQEAAASSNNRSIWEAQRQAWSQRRKSAGEALLIQNRINQHFVDPGNMQTSTPQQQTIERFSETLPDETADTPSLYSTMQPQSHISTSSQHCAITQSSVEPHRIARKGIDASTSSPPTISSTQSTIPIHRLTGRYEGGLQYGYEPGCGLGGSAGTRSAKTEASRKSVDVSRGFGVDLSDIPVFVAPGAR